MILVALGTQDKPFTRLLNVIQKEIDLGHIQEEIVVQAGCTKFDTKDMKVFDLIPFQEYEDLLNQADLIITHGGVGTIITALKLNKKVIACARLKQYGEHTNDHQIQIIDNFKEEGYILSYQDLDDFHSILEEVKVFTPRPFISNTNGVVHIVKEYLNQLKK